MKITEHFSDAEFGVVGTELDADVLDLLTIFCVKILEPIRDKWGPLRITSGYRDPEKNAATGGVSNSYHCWNAAKIAADCQPIDPGTLNGKALGISDVFDWIRLASGLPFDKVIIERGGNDHSETDDCIHLQFQRHPRRQAFIGETHGKSGYTEVEVGMGAGGVTNSELWGEG